MKKSILAILVIIPFLACCNKNEKGFIDPFPNDPYDKIKIGFGFDNEENIIRTLTTQETELLDKTIANLDDINSRLIKQESHGEIHERDYTRAFAGVHGEGYDSFNMMYDETINSSFYQNKTAALYERRKTTSHVESTYDYAYGQNTSKTDIKTLRYRASNSSGNTYVEDSDGEFAIEGKYEIIEDADDAFISATIVANSEPSKALYTSQTDYIFKPTSSDPIAGVSREGNVVIIREEHDPSGEYQLPDGRKYKTAKNTLRVSQLAKETDDTIGEYYLVKHARVYTETAITSNVIQPNVPVTFLANPIVINYKEEMHEFSIISTTDTSEEDIDPVEIIE